MTNYSHVKTLDPWLHGRDDRIVTPLNPDALLAEFPGPMADIGEWLRGVVRRALPDAVERVRAGWRIIGYDIPLGPRRQAYVAWIMVEAAHVHLGFPQGVLMVDPDGRMDGRGITKRARWVTLTPEAPGDDRELETLLREAARVARLSAGERAFLAEARLAEPR